LLRKANQKRFLDDLVIQKGEFDWKSLFGNESALNNALGEVEDEEDAHAAALATKEALAMEGADEADFGTDARIVGFDASQPVEIATDYEPRGMALAEDINAEARDDEEEGGACVDYMISFIRKDIDFFRDWKL
jgi:helicase SWR1